LSGEIVESAGAGLAIEWSASSFQEALLRLADPELRARLGENGKDAVKREYNWGAMRGRLLDLYRSL
jgi:glycosyltransferase involved in cell wall biosynthesis